MIFKELSVAKSCLLPESVPLKDDLKNQQKLAIFYARNPVFFQRAFD